MLSMKIENGFDLASVSMSHILGLLGRPMAL